MADEGGYPYSSMPVDQQQGYSYDQYGNAYKVDANGNPVQVASGFDNTGAQAQPAPQSPAPTPAPAPQASSYYAPQIQSGPSAGQGAFSGGMSGAGTGAAIGTSIAPGYGTAIGAGVGAVVGAVGGGMTSDGLSGKAKEAQTTQYDSIIRRGEGQKALYENRGANDVISSIAKYPNNPALAEMDARINLGRPLNNDEKKAISKGGYTTVSQNAALESQLYNGYLKNQVQAQNLGNAFKKSLIPATAILAAAALK